MEKESIFESILSHETSGHLVVKPLQMLLTDYFHNRDIKINDLIFPKPMLRLSHAYLHVLTDLASEFRHQFVVNSQNAYILK